MRLLSFRPIPTVATLLSPCDAFAHSAERGLVMLLPTGYYLTGAAMAVFLSFLLLSLAPVGLLQRMITARIRLFSATVRSPVWSSSIAFLGLLLLIISGYYGSRDPLSNPLPLFVWTGWWVGFTLLQFVLGNLWNYVNPWSGPMHWWRKLTGRKDSLFRLPSKLGFWPAIILFAGFAWFELVDLAPEDPSRLATAVAAYWLLVFIGMLLFGEQDWQARAEPFSIFFRLVGACSPLIREISTQESTKKRAGVTVFLAWPGQGFLSLPPLPLSGAMFVLLTLSSVSFDGISKTFLWFETIGINPLNFPGRSAVQAQNSIGLVFAFLFLALLFFGMIIFGWLLVRRGGSEPPVPGWQFICGKLVYSIIPISIAFHLAHYLTQLLVNGQYLLIAISDPFNRGWQIYSGHVSTSFLSNLSKVSIIWTAQTLVIALGHVIGITIAHIIALQFFVSRENSLKTAAESQLFLALLMVGYTVFGLWLLSTASI